tara:strand:+ start:6145 stop:6333 length:189 start_codon:yes stop_codon:yes gene_type:complete
MDNIAQPTSKYLKELIELYINSLNPLEQNAYKIAQTNLESSFDVEKCIGFIEFLKSNNYEII